jgi:hypothetical protein
MICCTVARSFGGSKVTPNDFNPMVQMRKGARKEQTITLEDYCKWINGGA